MGSERRQTLTRRWHSGKLRMTHLAAVFAGCVLLLSGPLALAQTEADRATARSLAAEGYRALQESDFATAEDRFRRADTLVHAPTLVVDHARALVGLGRLVEAHERYELVLREGVPATAPRVWKRAFEDADGELAALKPRLAWLVLYVDAPADASVTVDAADVPHAALGVPRATDPGARSVTVSAPGFLSQEVQVELAEGEQRELRFALEAEQSEVPPDEPPPKVVPEAPPPVRADTGGGVPRAWTYVSLGVGAAGLVGGGLAGVFFWRAGSELDADCPRSKCPIEYKDDVKQYRQLGWATGIGLGLGVAGLATGVYLFLTEDAGEANSAGVSSGVHPLVTHDSVGVWGTF